MICIDTSSMIAYLRRAEGKDIPAMKGKGISG